ncbi:hypothetical protein C7451_101405 [Blastomonas natatoria]|uniref:Exosortase A-associated hydrolase 2 n=1 Tax=Blastomonas natatoria TaxID=34015 RepID=A0A2V3VCN1_9SPHN|nr:hypothetical protein [Blastomonas natatoria]PXW79340.1 hypothetical protein C7451_101405 [Blastomonas natatoria]
MIRAYRFDGNDELCLCHGPEGGPALLILPPLFDEANRVRHLLVEAARALADHGIASLLPDLPGCNESLVPLDRASISLWQAALIACAEQLGPISHVAAIRGGALLDGALGDLPRWRLAPVKGGQLLRTMLRARIASDREAGISSSSETLMEAARNQGIELAGNNLSPSMIRELDSAAPSEGSAVRLARFADDPLDAEARIAGAPLWLRAEPAHDPAMAASIAADLARWVI